MGGRLRDSEKCVIFIVGGVPFDTPHTIARIKRPLVVSSACFGPTAPHKSNRTLNETADPTPMAWAVLHNIGSETLDLWGKISKAAQTTSVHTTSGVSRGCSLGFNRYHRFIPHQPASAPHVRRFFCARSHEPISGRHYIWCLAQKKPFAWSGQEMLTVKRRPLTTRCSAAVTEETFVM